MTLIRQWSNVAVTTVEALLEERVDRLRSLLGHFIVRPHSALGRLSREMIHFKNEMKDFLDEIKDFLEAR